MADDGNKANRVGGMLFAGCILAGIGIGMAFDRPDIGVLLGLGAGLILMGLTRSRR